MRAKEKIMWPGGSQPKDSPKCGFDNERCPTETSGTTTGKEKKFRPWKNVFFYIIFTEAVIKNLERSISVRAHVQLSI